MIFYITLGMRIKADGLHRYSSRNRYHGQYPDGEMKCLVGLPQIVVNSLLALEISGEHLSRDRCCISF